MDITQLLSADEISHKLKHKVLPGRLLELADAALIPHYRIDGRVYFYRAEVLRWLKENLIVRIPGSPLPTAVSVTPIFVRPDDAEVPDVLLALTNYLLPLSIQSLGFANFAGVYFLCRDREVVYVGQSKVVAGRVGAHLGQKTFDFAFCMRVPESDLNYVEGQFISALQPEYNVGKHGRLSMPLPREGSQWARNLISGFNGLATPEVEIEDG